MVVSHVRTDLRYCKSRDFAEYLVASWHSVPSKDGKFIATVLNSTVIIRLALESEKYHTFSLPQSSTSQWRFLKWYDKPSKGLSHEHTGNDWHSGSSHRFLLANDDDVLIWDVDDLKWHAEINGAANCLGRIYNVQFGSTANEVLVSSSFGVKLTIWSLLTTRGVEVKDPKTTSRFCDCRPRSGHLAILVRDTAHDALVLLPPGKPDQVKNVELATVDAQGVKWSPDGRWIAIWESGSYGYKVLTYTADGNHYKTYLRGQDTENVGLGVSMLRWSPSGSFLAIGDYNQCAVILRTNTVGI